MKQHIDTNLRNYYEIFSVNAWACCIRAFALPATPQAFLIEVFLGNKSLSAKRAEREPSRRKPSSIGGRMGGWVGGSFSANFSRPARARIKAIFGANKFTSASTWGLLGRALSTRRRSSPGRDFKRDGCRFDLSIHGKGVEGFLCLFRSGSGVNVWRCHLRCYEGFGLI